MGLGSVGQTPSTRTGTGLLVDNHAWGFRIFQNVPAGCPAIIYSAQTGPFLDRGSIEGSFAAPASGVCKHHLNSPSFSTGCGSLRAQDDNGEGIQN